MEYQEELDIAIEAAKKASTAVMSIYQADSISFVNKEVDQTPLTRADLESNLLICGTLQSYFSYPILSEENKDDLNRLKAKRIWIIDPLDGTKEFLAKNGEFTINIALVENGRPVVGVIAQPDKNTIFFAAKGLQTKKLQNGKEKKIEISSKNINNNLKIAVSRSHFSPDLKEKLENSQNFELVSCGSALKYCMVATGDIDASLRKTPLHEWDIAAADCILHESNATLTDFSGKTFTYNQQNTLITSGLVASGKHIHASLLKLIQQ